MGIVFVHPQLVREVMGIVTRKTAVDGAGYRPIAAMVESFNRAGIQLDTFRAAEFAGDLSVSPLYQNYIDPVDRDEALQVALDNARKAREDFEVARRAAIDKRKKLREDEIMKLADRLRRVRDGETFETELPPKEEQASS